MEGPTETKQEKKITEKKEGIPPRNLVTHPDQTIAAMTQIETSEWLREQLQERETRDDPTVFNALRWLKMPGKARRTFTVSGWGAVNRWVVRRDGSVCFLLSELMKAGTPESAARASELGFPVVDRVGKAENE